MNFLFIVTESKSANGICCKAVMEQLASSGESVFCITNSEYGDFPRANGVKYICVKPRFTYRAFSKAEIKTGFKRQITLFKASLINKLKLVLSIPIWPLISPAYSRRIYKLSLNICITENIDCVVPVYTQIDSLLATAKIKKKLKSIKYVPYFLDSFSGGYGPKCFSKDWVIKRGLRWEACLLPNADKIIMMQSSKPHYEKYASDKDYFEKIVFLDLPLLNTALNAEKSNLLPKDKINMVYLGTIPLHIRNPEYFFKVLRELKNDNVELHIFGSCTVPQILNDAAEKDSRIHLHSSVSHDTALSLMKSADFLINFGNNNSYMTPCKIFEYMSFSKPIISLSPIENEPSAIYLEQYPISLILKEYQGDVELDALLLGKFIDNYPLTEKLNANEIEKQFYLNTPKAFAEELKRL